MIIIPNAARCQAPRLDSPGKAAPIHEGPLAQRRCFILGCWLRGDSCSGASAPWAEGSGSGKSPAGWSSKRVRRGWPPGCPPGARHHPRPGVAMVSPRYCYGIATVLLRYCSHVDAINMGATPVRYRGDTVPTPRLLAWGYAGGGPGILNSEKGTRHRPPLAGNRPGRFIFTMVSLAQPTGAGQQRVFIGGGARKGRIHAPKLEKSAGKRSKKALTPEPTTG